MGAILSPTPAMRRYSVEMRRETFVLTRTAATPAARITRFTAALPAPDLNALLAALQQVTTHPGWTRWEQEGRPGTDDTAWTAQPDGNGETADDRWSVTLDQEELRITGLWTVHHERDLWSAEIPYRATEALHKALTNT